MLRADKHESNAIYLQSGAGGGGPGQPLEGMRGRRCKPLLPRRTRLPAGPASEGPGRGAPGLQQPCGDPAGVLAAGAGADAAGLPAAPACARPAGGGATQSFIQACVQGQRQQLLLVSLQCIKPSHSVCAAAASAAADVRPAGREDALSQAK